MGAVPGGLWGVGGVQSESRLSASVSHFNLLSFRHQDIHDFLKCNMPRGVLHYVLTLLTLEEILNNGYPH